MPPKIDHDGYAKRTLTTFLPEFLELFAPEVLPYTDLSNVTFLDKELPRADPRSKKRAADFVAQVKFRGQDAFFLFHIEPQSSQQDEFAYRMHRYYAKLLDKYRKPIYPIALLTFASPLEVQPAAYAINFPDLEVLRFQFRVIQLNRLSWRDFINRPNPVAAALMAQMRVAKKDRPLVKAHCLAMLLGLELDEASGDLVWEMVDTYLPLDDKEAKTFEAELAKIVPAEEEEETEMLGEFLTRRERGLREGLALGLRKGRAEGIAEGEQNGMRNLTMELLAHRVGELPESYMARLAALTAQQLKELSLATYDFRGLADLGAWLDAHGDVPPSKPARRRKAKKEAQESPQMDTDKNR